jgi:hypothetical protein
MSKRAHADPFELPIHQIAQNADLDIVAASGRAFMPETEPLKPVARV